MAAQGQQAGPQRLLAARSDRVQRLLAQPGDHRGDRRVGYGLHHQGRLRQQVGTAGGPGPFRRGPGGRHRPREITGEIAGAAEVELRPGAGGGVRPGQGDRQRRPVQPHPLLEGEPVHGRRRGAQRPPARLGALAVGGEREPVPRDLREMLVQLARPVGLQGGGRGPVQRDAARGRDRRAHGVAGQRVGEAQLAGPRLREQAGTDRGIGRAEAARHGCGEHVRDHRQRERPADDRPGLDQPPRVGAEPVDPGPHGVAHRPRRVAGVPGAVGDGARHLADEEGVATGGVVHLGDGHAVGAERVKLPADVGRSEPGQLQLLDVRSPAQVGQRPRERPVRLGVAQGGQQQQRGARGAVGQVPQHQQRRLVAPVDVVEHDQQRPGRGPGQDRPGDGVDGREAVLRRLDVGGRDVTGVQLPQHLPPRPERRDPVGVDAVSPRHVAVGEVSGQLLGQPGLADTRFPADEHEPPAGRHRVVEPAAQRVELLVPADQRRATGVGPRRHADQHAASRRCTHPLAAVRPDRPRSGPEC